MRILHVVPGNIEAQPYLKYYLDIYRGFDVSVDFIGWNRDSLGYHNEAYADVTKLNYNWPSSIRDNAKHKFLGYLGFYRFVKAQLKCENYGIVVVHTIPAAILLYPLLRNIRYIFDIRDYSSILPFVRPLVATLVKKSLVTIISSPGYQNWLPKGVDYVLSHNISKNMLQRADSIPVKPQLGRNSVLTIGQIVYSTSNIRVINELGCANDVSVHFVGQSPWIRELENHSKEIGSSARFYGPYDKKNELDIASKFGLMNILVSDTKLQPKYALANRLYLALVVGMPMITTTQSYTREYIGEASLFCEISDGESLLSVIRDFINQFDFNSYNCARRKVIDRILGDVKNFESVIIDILRD